MPYDYSRVRATADRLIRRFGRPIILKATDRTPGNPLMPWRGPSAPVIFTQLTLFGVFVPPNQVRIFGLSALGESTENVDLISFSEQVIITYPGDNDLKPFKVVNDGTSDWGVTAIQLLRPGASQVLAFLGVRR